MAVQRTEIEIAPRELVTTGDGKVFVGHDVTIHATSPEALEAGKCVVDNIMQANGGFAEGDHRSPRGKSFGFSAEEWKAPWQPKGPKPPWANKPLEN